MHDQIDPWRGAELSRLRRSRSLTQAEAGKESLVAASTVKRAERGDPLKADNLRALCSLYRVTPEALQDAARAAEAHDTGAPSTAPPSPAARQGGACAPAAAPSPVARTVPPVQAVPPPSPATPRHRPSMFAHVEAIAPHLARHAVGVLLVFVATFEAASWTPVVRDPLVFALAQFVAVLSLALVCVVVALGRPLGPGASLDARMAFLSRCLVACVAGFLFVQAVVGHAFVVMAAESAHRAHALVAFGDAAGALRAARLADPSRDDRRDRWWLARIEATAAGRDAPWLGSPTAYEAMFATTPSCLVRWADAAAPGSSRCDLPAGAPSFDRRLAFLRLFGLADGELTDHGILDRATAHFDALRRDPPRRLVDAGPLPR